MVYQTGPSIFAKRTLLHGTTHLICQYSQPQEIGLASRSQNYIVSETMAHFEIVCLPNLKMVLKSSLNTITHHSTTLIVGVPNFEPH